MTTAVLRVLGGSGQVRTYELKRQRTIIGRGGTSHVSIDDASVAPEHALLLATEKGFLITEFDKHAEIRVAGRLVSGAHFLSDGEHINLGTARLRFEIIGGPVQATKADSGDPPSRGSAPTRKEEKGSELAAAPEPQRLPWPRTPPPCRAPPRAGSASPPREACIALQEES